MWTDRKRMTRTLLTRTLQIVASATMLQCGPSSGTDGAVAVSRAAVSVAGASGFQASERGERERHRRHHRDTDPLDHLYVGCRDATGTILHYLISSETGAVTPVDTTLANAAVSNTAIDADDKFLYVAHTDTGRISTFARDPVTGSLSLRAIVTVPGTPLPTDNPATQTLEIDHTGRFLLAANFTANTVLVYAINADGTVGSLVETRDDGLNAHETLLNVRNAFALVPYLGSNYIAVYKFDEKVGSLTPNTPFTTNIPVPSSGPRHLALHRNGTWLYAISETAGTITFFSFDNGAGTLTPIETVSSLPATFTGVARSGSEIEIDEAGRFLYVSNRLDQVANGILGVYSISQKDGKLTAIQFEDSRGATPRQFSLSPEGNLLVVGNQSSSTMSVFKVNDDTGVLTYVATTPVCSTPFFARMVAP